MKPLHLPTPHIRHLPRLNQLPIRHIMLMILLDSSLSVCIYCSVENVQCRFEFGVNVIKKVVDGIATVVVVIDRPEVSDANGGGIVQFSALTISAGEVVSGGGRLEELGWTRRNVVATDSAVDWRVVNVVVVLRSIDGDAWVFVVVLPLSLGDDDGVGVGSIR